MGQMMAGAGGAAGAGSGAAMGGALGSGLGRDATGLSGMMDPTGSAMPPTGGSSLLGMGDMDREARMRRLLDMLKLLQATGGMSESRRPPSGPTGSIMPPPPGLPGQRGYGSY